MNLCSWARSPLRNWPWGSREQQTHAAWQRLADWSGGSLAGRSRTLPRALCGWRDSSCSTFSLSSPRDQLPFSGPLMVAAWGASRCLGPWTTVFRTVPSRGFPSVTLVGVHGFEAAHSEGMLSQLSLHWCPSWCRPVFPWLTSPVLLSSLPAPVCFLRALYYLAPLVSDLVAFLSSRINSFSCTPLLPLR